MSRGTSQALLADAPPPPGAVFAATVSRAVPPMVTLDAYGSTHEWGPATWLGADIPVRGTRCLALIDDHGDVWARPAVQSAISAAVQAALNLKAALGGESWITPTLTNGSNFAAEYNSVGYWRDGFGVVHLRGLWQAPNVALPITIFTLPAGYRPAARELFVAHATTAMGRVDVQAAGGVLFMQGGVAAGNYVSLDGMTFRAV